MERLIEMAVKQRRIILFLAAVTALFGFFSYQQLPKQENPLIKVNAAMITTYYPGATAEEVESLVTKEIESVLSEMDALKQLFSDSMAGISVVFAIYQEDADIDSANGQVREKMEQLNNRLPVGSTHPVIDTNLGESAGLMVTLSGDRYSYEQLTAFGETMEAALRKVKGIYKTALLGNVEKQVTVEVAQQELNQVGLSLGELSELLWVQQQEVPAGTFSYGPGRMTVAMGTAYETVEDVAGQVVAVSPETGGLLRLKDLARVEMERQADTATILQGETPAVLLAAYFQEDQNMIPVGEAVRHQLAAMGEQLPPDLVITEVLFQPGDVARSLRQFIGSLLRGMGQVLLMAGCLFLLVIIGVIPRLPLAFFPKADKEVLYVETYVEQSGDIDKTAAIARQINTLLEEVPEVVQVTTGVGTPLPKFYTTMMPVAPQPELTRAIVAFDLQQGDRFATKDQLAMHLQDQLDTRVAGAKATVRLLEIADPAAPVTIRLHGEDLDRLKQVAMEVEQALKQLPGTMNVSSNASDKVYQYQVAVKGGEAALAGLLHADIHREVSLALFGSRQAVLRQGGKAYDIQVKSDVATLAQLEQMAIKSGLTGEKVALTQVADVRLLPQTERISRFNQERSVVVTSDIRPGFSAVTVSNALEKQLHNGWDTRGVTISFEGDRETIGENFSHMGMLGLLVLCLIYTILLVEFKSFRDPLIILFTVPLSMTGALLGLWLFRQPLSLTALLGIISLMGIVVNNAILLMDHIKGGRCQGKTAEAACFMAVQGRFRPIVLSAMTTIMGLMPLALSTSELFKPMAIALISGLVLATLLTMVIIPLLYLWMEERFDRKIKASFQETF